MLHNVRKMRISAVQDTAPLQLRGRFAPVDRRISKKNSNPLLSRPAKVQFPNCSKETIIHGRVEGKSTADGVAPNPNQLVGWHFLSLNDVVVSDILIQ